MRKALTGINNAAPDAVVAEFNFQPGFRDRTSSQESKLAVVSRHPARGD